MKALLIAGLITTFSLCVLSCGASESARDDILKLGGISSTGNKDEDPAAKQQDSSAETPTPTPNQGIVCEHPVDLSGRKYELNATSGSALQSCSREQLSGACMLSMEFHNKAEVTVNILTETNSEADSAPIVTAVRSTYLMCDLELSIRPAQIDTSSAIEAEYFKSSENLETLTHRKFPLIFDLSK